MEKQLSIIKANREKMHELRATITSYFENLKNADYSTRKQLANEKKFIEQLKGFYNLCADRLMEQCVPKLDYYLPEAVITEITDRIGGCEGAIAFTFDDFDIECNWKFDHEQRIEHSTGAHITTNFEWIDFELEITRKGVEVEIIDFPQIVIKIMEDAKQFNINY